MRAIKKLVYGILWLAVGASSLGCIANFIDGHYMNGTGLLLAWLVLGYFMVLLDKPTYATMTKSTSTEVAIDYIEWWAKQPLVPPHKFDKYTKSISDKPIDAFYLTIFEFATENHRIPIYNKTCAKIFKNNKKLYTKICTEIMAYMDWKYNIELDV